MERTTTNSHAEMLRELVPAHSSEPFEEEEDAEERLARSRDRNREHARRTRLRKKAQLQSLQNRVEGLENKRHLFCQILEECRSHLESCTRHDLRK